MPVQFDSAPVSLVPGGGAAPKAVASAASPGFGDVLQQLVQSVDKSAGEANTAVSDMLGGSGDVHDAMIALQRAETSLELTIQVRNKLVQAYQEIMRMPV
jgi:flagellar hook-basal body complex protein FliE